MPSKGKLLSDYTDQEWKRLRQSMLRPSFAYWITVPILASLLLLRGLWQLNSEGFIFEGILLAGAGAILICLFIADVIRRLRQRSKK